ncbi:O-antigen ligase family protein [Quadrisphaera oryzae]|uniref:O-antigen ligase family protein n=1 Tax=Quadrisphaera sp. RL12-1S TaxID=2763011 RepID=UPI00351C7AAD
MNPAVLVEALGQRISLAAGAALLCSLLVFVVRALTTRGAKQVSTLPLFLALPLATVWASSVLTGESLNYFVLASFVLVPAFWLFRRAGEEDFDVFGYLALAVGGLSLILAFSVPDVALVVSGVSEDKPLLFGTLLAGPFTQSNVLGLFLVAGLPFTLELRRRRSRWLGGALIVWALLWTGSRTSLTAAACVVGIVTICHWRRRLALVLSITALAVCSFLMIFLPFTVNRLSDYSGRGSIWRESLKAFSEHPLLGGGPRFYLVSQTYNNSLGPAAFHGHNTFVHTISTTGIVGLLALSTFFLVATLVAIRFFADGRSGPLLFLVVLAVTSVYETSLAFDNLAWILRLAPLLVLLNIASRKRTGYGKSHWAPASTGGSSELSR